MSCGSGWRLWKGSLLCLRERCYKGSGKTSINHVFVVLAVDLSRCTAWMSTLTSRWATAVKIYEEAVQCRSAAAVIQSSPKTSGVVFISGSCTRSPKHTMKHNNLNCFTHFPLMYQHSLPQTGEDSLSTFFPNPWSHSIMQNKPVENWNISEDLTRESCKPLLKYQICRTT